MELKPEVTDIPCDQCGAMMVIKMGRYGKFLACPNYPACHNTRQLLTPVEAPCPKCGAQVFQRRSRKGRIFSLRTVSRVRLYLLGYARAGTVPPVWRPHGAEEKPQRHLRGVRGQELRLSPAVGGERWLSR